MSKSEVEIRAQKRLSQAKAELKAASEAQKEQERIADLQAQTDQAIAALSEVGKTTTAAKPKAGPAPAETAGKA